MEKKNYWPQIESTVAMTNSVTAKYVVEAERITKATIAVFNSYRKMIGERRNVEQYISNEASS